jgi:hypothetical protein
VNGLAPLRELVLGLNLADPAAAGSVGAGSVGAGSVGAAARLASCAVLSVAHDPARTARLHRDPAVPAAVIAICTRLLGLQNNHSAES